MERLMNTPVENISEEKLEKTVDPFDDTQMLVNTELEEEENTSKESSDLALKLVNAIKSMNSEEITHYEMVNLFSKSEELKCLYLFIRSLPYNPIAKIYPEAPFLFFKGVSLPKIFDLSEEVARDVETFMKGQNPEYFSELRLHDLDQPYLDAYESAIRIYNDMVEKTRDSYHANVKLAKSQVMEVSAVFVCLFIILITIIGIS